jgi:hypothetical protein
MSHFDYFLILSKTLVNELFLFSRGRPQYFVDLVKVVIVSALGCREVSFYCLHMEQTLISINFA